MTAPTLIGRRAQTEWLAEAADTALAGHGALLLLAGEAGVGKTHLADAALSGHPVLRGEAHPLGATPYGPIVAALRARLREDPAALDGVGPLRPHLAALLPELTAPDGVTPRPASALPPATLSSRPGAAALPPIDASPAAATASSRAATASPRPATASPRPATAPPRPATAPPRPATAPPRPATAPPRPAAALPPAARSPRPAVASPPLVATDRATLFEAVRATLAALAPAVIVLDDLQWSDGATLDLLAALAVPLSELPVLVVGIYRTDEIGRGHPVRRLRADLRRARVLRELVVAPLDAAASRELVARTLGAEPAPALAEALYDRTQGIPFFLQELAAGLQAGDRLCAGPAGLELEHDTDVPIPETIRDAVLLRTVGLSDTGRSAAEAAAVVGSEFRLDLAPGLDELLQTGLIHETRPGHAAFRHALVRGAIYEDIPWRRRRDLHAAIADALAFGGAPSVEIAAHRLAAGDRDRALDAFLAAAQELACVHAHRDAAAAACQALDLWPDGARQDERLTALDVYAQSAELAGDLAEAARALREAAALRLAEDPQTLGATTRRLAGLYELQGDRERALLARRDAVAAFDAAGRPAEAAGERLVLAAYGQSAGRHQEAVDLALAAGADAQHAARNDLRARALGLEGVARAKRGQYAAGVGAIRTGLALALEHELTTEAAELYQRLATAMESAADYGGARDALTTAVGLCEANGAEGQEHTCLSCLAYVLRELGDWEPAASLCRDLGAGTARADDALVADGILGSILAFRGDTRAARPLLLRCRATAARLDVISMGVDSEAVLALIEDDSHTALEHASGVLERWERSEDHHYAVWGLRVAAERFAHHGDVARARAAAAALSAITEVGHPDALAALSHALGEIALAEGRPDEAADKLTRALELHAELDIPFERAQIALRAGTALAQAGRREAALQRLEESYRAARRLGAKPLATLAADAFARLGEPLERRLGRREAAKHAQAGLSRREVEVTRLVALGRTNREIARELFLSPRTVDMHVRNILSKLDCRTRTEAASRAGELGLLTQ